MTTLKAIQADITTMAVDVIVNAANSSLLGGGNVVLSPRESRAGILARQRFGRGQDAPRSRPGKRRAEGE